MWNRNYKLEHIEEGYSFEWKTSLRKLTLYQDLSQPDKEVVEESSIQQNCM